MAAERGVLSYVPYLKEAVENGAAPDKTGDPFGPRAWRSSMVKLPGKNRALNELSVERVGEPVEETLVMLHGYGAGLGFFYRNFEPLTRAKGWRLYALDMLGMGNSARPAFHVRAKDQAGKVAEAESWFIDALEDWRRERGIDNFTLLGHSLGGYLAVAYALKYPGRLNKLILASPVGIPEDPFAVNAEMPEPTDSRMQNEFTQDQESITSSTSASDRAARAQGKPAASAPRRPLPSWVVWLWDANFSPFNIVRWAGPLGPRFVSGWTSRRFSHLPDDEARALHDYAFGIFRQRGSGEYALPYLLAPGAFARSPLIHRIQDVGRQPIPPPAPEGKPGDLTASSASSSATEQAARESGIPVVLMYGEKDWMDVAGGLAAEEKLKQVHLKMLLHGTAEEKRRENGSARVVIISKAGHHLYLDNADEFNEVVRQELEATREDNARRRAAGLR